MLTFSGTEHAKSIASSPHDSPSIGHSAHGNPRPTSIDIGANATRKSARSPTSFTTDEMERLESLDGTKSARRSFGPNEDGEQSPGTTSNQSTLSSRTGTLSWQRRPTSRESETPHRRPTSKALFEAPALAPSNFEDDQLHEEPTRNQIVQSLNSRDPAWFRQTAERGIGSAAYRKSNDSEETFTASGAMRLPGMSIDLPPETDASSPAAASERSTSPSRNDSVRTTGNWNNRSSRVSTSSLGRNPHASPLPASSGPVLDPSQNHEGSAADIRSSTLVFMSPAHGRMSPERPPSPTKGLGGFVQSAMLKRSDSVNKRWKVDAPPGLTRADSIASTRSTASTTRGPRSPQKESRLPDSNQRSSPTTSSRPNSSHEQDGDPHRQKQKRDSRNNDELPTNTLVEDVPATSPSKTADPKRWSPTKASWLESALNRPESPTKFFSPPIPQQPSWKANAQKTKDTKSGSAAVSGIVIQGSSDMNAPVITMDSQNSPAQEHPEKPIIGPREDKTKGPLTPEAQPEPKAPLVLDNNSQREAKSPGGGTLPQLTTNSPGDKTERWKASGASAESKPNTPPKPNFRANLKSREKSDDKGSNEELEFKNVFGKLKRTEIKNYVAPDELKNNILRGKAGLNITGGPKKTQRIDEFKESILKQKEAMKSGGGSMIKRSPESVTTATKKPSPAIPEALSKRQQMSRSSSAQSDQAAKDGPVEIYGLGKETSFRPSLGSTKVTDTVGDKGGSKSSPFTNIPQTYNASEEKPAALSKSTSLKALPGPISKVGNSQSPKRPLSTSSSANTQPLKTRDNSKAGSLAERLNPALAGLISRGPGTAAKPSDESSERQKITSSGVTSIEDADKASSGPSLTHATKSRARGPKRRLPVAGQPIRSTSSRARDEKMMSDDNKGLPEVTSIQSTQNTMQPIPTHQPVDLTNSNDESNDIQNVTSGSIASSKTISELPKRPSGPPESVQNKKLKPAIAAKSPILQKVSSPRQPQSLDTDVDSDTTEPNIGDSNLPEDAPKGAKSPRVGRKSPEDSNSPYSPMLTRPDSPNKTDLLRDAATTKRSRSPHKPAVFLPPKTAPRDSKLLVLESNLNDELPLEAPTSEIVTSTNIAGDKTVSRLLAKLFTQLPSTRNTGAFDTYQFLHSQKALSQSTAQTVLSLVSQLDPSGRSTPLPAYKEHILFEDGIYLCVYTYHPPHKELEKHTEVYLWVGDQVPEAAVEDARLFGRKAAREHSTKLQVLRQGKESPTFLQAIAGVLLVRRNRSNEQYMLSTRSYTKYLIFNEVDFDARSLCSGFPFLMITRSGKQYLWKGKGSTADELGVARLIGMDLGLTGELSEIDEGSEPDEFFTSFPSPQRRTTSPTSWTTHWSLKPKLPRYCARLYRISVQPDRPTSTISSLWGRRGSSPPKNKTFTADIVEIEPFAQRDLEPGQIYILDAYFEIFVYVVHPLVPYL